MKKETTQKKIWQKPEVQDLDVKNTELVKYSDAIEWNDITHSHGPAAS